MKSIIGKLRVQNDFFPKSLIVGTKEITDKQFIGEKINSFFVNTGKTSSC